MTDLTTPVSPYINTTLVTPIMLHPNQMDNKIYIHLKKNINEKLVGRCYLNYGYISKIFKIEDMTEGVIEPEDPTSSAKIIVKFSCRLCNPFKNKYLICKIDRMNKALIGAINGPIIVIITPENINEQKFFKDSERNIRFKKDAKMLEPNDYVKIYVLQSTFGNYDKNIICFGNLYDLATKDEIDFYLKDNQNLEISTESD